VPKPPTKSRDFALDFQLLNYQVEPFSRRLSLLAKSRRAVDYPITKFSDRPIPLSA